VKDQNTVLLVIALALAIAGGVIGFIGKAWAIVLVAAAVGILVCIDLF
jgi:hypothetical protein